MIEKKEQEIFEHIMADLETVGNKSNSAIVSIGAIKFNLDTGQTGEEFYRKIDLQSCLDVGLVVNASAIYWWMKQNEVARYELAQGGQPLLEVLHDLDEWINSDGNKPQLWGNGARFDIGLLEDAYVACGYHEMPWDFHNELDLRTLAYFRPEIKKQVIAETKEPLHHPITDCKVQIKYASLIWQKMNNIEPHE